MYSNIYKISGRRCYILINNEIKKDLKVYNKDKIFLHLYITEENKLSILLSNKKSISGFNIIYSKDEKLIKTNKRSKQYKLALNSTITDVLASKHSEVFFKKLSTSNTVIYQCIFK